MMAKGILAALQRLQKVSPTAPTDNEKQPPLNEFPTVEQNITSNVSVERVTEQSQSINDGPLHSPPNPPIPTPQIRPAPHPPSHPTSQPSIHPIPPPQNYPPSQPASHPIPHPQGHPTPQSSNHHVPPRQDSPNPNSEPSLRDLMSLLLKTNESINQTNAQLDQTNAKMDHQQDGQRSPQ